MTRPDQPCLWHGEVPPFIRIVVGIRTNLTQQVSTGPREGGHSTTRGVLTSLELSIFFISKLIPNHIYCSNQSWIRIRMARALTRITHLPTTIDT